MVVEGRLGVDSADNALLILQELKIDAIPFDREHMLEARGAWQRFGKGRHGAALNLGDCCAYAAAAISNEPLLCKGNDFARADLPLVKW